MEGLIVLWTLYPKVKGRTESAIKLILNRKEISGKHSEIFVKLNYQMKIEFLIIKMSFDKNSHQVYYPFIHKLFIQNLSKK
jgi:hypothetical protein